MNEPMEALPERLFDLLTDLSLDPLKLDAWLRDPAAVMADAGLSSAESAALLRRLDGKGRAARPACGATFFDPGDDPEPNPDPMPPEVS